MTERHYIEAYQQDWLPINFWDQSELLFLNFKAADEWGWHAFFKLALLLLLMCAVNHLSHGVDLYIQVEDDPLPFRKPENVWKKFLFWINAVLLK